MPAPRVSDRWPIEPHWYEQNASRRRKKRNKAGDRVHKPIPTWLAKDPTFNDALRTHLQEWESNRIAHGLASLSEFNAEVYQFAGDYKNSQLILAQAPAHKLEVCREMRRRRHAA